MMGYLGALLLMFGFVLVVPLAVQFLYAQQGEVEAPVHTFLVPGAASLFLGLVLKRRKVLAQLDTRRSMILCALAWIAISLVAAAPFVIALGVSWLDAFFESVSGFTTTGITMLTGLDRMPRSILFWRSLTQWLGGLGILTFFLVVTTAGGSAHRLFSAESHKIFSKRPAPGLLHTLKILWGIYAALTGLIVLLLVVEGMSLYDAVSHAFTALSTGGYSPYDASIAHYGGAGYPYARAIEYTLILGMVLGGTNFFIHYRLLTGDVRSLWDNLEARLWWGLLAGATGILVLDRVLRNGWGDVEATIRGCLFQVTAIATTTGFATEDIAGPTYPALSKQVFLVLMVIGGCVGSTGGGIKVLRIGILFRMVARQIKRVLYGRAVVAPVAVDGEIVDAEEVRRISALFFAWMLLLAVGAGVTALLSGLGALESASGMFSALGNIGPCYISVGDMTALHPLIKLTYILGMLAGRLEILPILLLFSPRAWR
jgi:trk system potassium uptake protein TrkH